MTTATTPAADLTALLLCIASAPYPGLYIATSRTSADTHYLTKVAGDTTYCTCPHGTARLVEGKTPYCWHYRTATKMWAAAVATVAPLPVAA